MSKIKCQIFEMASILDTLAHCDDFNMGEFLPKLAVHTLYGSMVCLEISSGILEILLISEFTCYVVKMGFSKFPAAYNLIVSL